MPYPATIAWLKQLLGDAVKIRIFQGMIGRAMVRQIDSLTFAGDDAPTPADWIFSLTGADEVTRQQLLIYLKQVLGSTHVATTQCVPTDAALNQLCLCVLSNLTTIDDLLDQTLQKQANTSSAITTTTFLLLNDKPFNMDQCSFTTPIANLNLTIPIDVNWQQVQAEIPAFVYDCLKCYHDHLLDQGQSIRDPFQYLYEHFIEVLQGLIALDYLCRTLCMKKGLYTTP